jgi:hypothetical protein
VNSEGTERCLPSKPEPSKVKPETTTPFDHFLYWDKLGRKGQACRVIANNGKIISVEFEDGFYHVFNRQAIRQRK